MKGKHISEAQKGKMARGLVYYCVCVLTVSGIWAAVVKTRTPTADLSDVLTFISVAFGGELLLLCCKRIFAKSRDHQTEI